MRLIDADALMPELQDLIKIENQIYGRESWGLTLACWCEVKTAPTIEPERKKGKWIPCSEKLPDEDYGNDVWQHSDFALVTVVNDGDDSNTFVDIARTENGEWKMGTPIDGDTEFPEWCHVIAWMPLPEPYMREPE